MRDAFARVLGYTRVTGVTSESPSANGCNAVTPVTQVTRRGAGAANVRHERCRQVSKSPSEILGEKKARNEDGNALRSELSPRDEGRDEQTPGPPTPKEVLRCQTSLQPQRRSSPRRQRSRELLDASLASGSVTRETHEDVIGLLDELERNHLDDVDEQAFERARSVLAEKMAEAAVAIQRRREPRLLWRVADADSTA